MISFAMRNWKLFHRDSGTVFFSLLGPIMIIALYILFLKDTTISSLGAVGDTAENLVNSWIMAGIIASATVTTCLSGYGTMIRDQESGIAKDFQTSPVARRTIIGGYLLNSLIIGTIMSLITLVLAEVYIVLTGGTLLAPEQLLVVVAIIIAAVFSAAGIVGFIASTLNSQGAFSGANIAIGAAIGFLVGAYIPLGSLPDGVRNVLEFIPTAHAARALREIMMADPMAASFDGAPASVLDAFKNQMGVTFEIGTHSVTMSESIGFLLASGALGFLFAMVTMWLKNRVK